MLRYVTIPVGCLVAVVVFAATATAQSEPAALYQQTSEVNNLMVQYEADYGSLTRYYVVKNSPERRERLQTLVKDYDRKLQALPFDKLNTGTQVDYLLYQRTLEEEQYRLQQEAEEYAAVIQWLPFADKIYAMEKARRRGAVPDAQHIANELDSISRQLKTLQAKLATANFSVETGRRAEGVVQAMRDALKSVYEFYNGYDPLFTWWVPQPYQRLDSVLGVYKDSIKARENSRLPQKDDGSGIKGNPIGVAELNRRLQYEMIAYTPEELVAIANKEFAWCDAEMLKASRDMGFGDNWKAALEKVKTTYVKPGEQPAVRAKIHDEDSR